MCSALEKKCKCGNATVSIHNNGSVLPFDVVLSLFCPHCSNEKEFDSETMVNDNGWVIEYDIDLAKQFVNKMGVKAEKITPEFIFDNNYSSWNGYSPNEHLEASREKTEIVKMASADHRKYLKELRIWTENRIKRLSSEGWRKAKKAENDMLTI